MGNITRSALTIGAALLVAGCGGSQAPLGAPALQAPVGVSPAMPRQPSASYQVLHSFGGSSDGAQPMASLVLVGSALYGTTYGGGTYGLGTVFRITKSGSESVLHSFGSGSDGAQPMAGLIDIHCCEAKDTLDGTTYGGGTYGGGTVFRIGTDGTEQVVYNFGSGSDGAHPEASLIFRHGVFYGTTERGGTYDTNVGGAGTVFIVGGNGYEKVLHNFGHASDGSLPESSLIGIKGAFYGTTMRGGTYDTHSGGAGTVFGITGKGKERVIHSFGGAHDGALPDSSLSWVEANIYGTTYKGGAHGLNAVGTAFTVSTTGTSGTGYEQVLYDFDKQSGAHPSGQLIGVNATLYGTTERGGTYGGGTVFSLSTSGVEHVLHDFGSSSDGKFPYGGLVDVGGTLYGTTKEGGASNEGTVFALTP